MKKRHPRPRGGGRRRAHRRPTRRCRLGTDLGLPPLRRRPLDGRLREASGSRRRGIEQRVEGRQVLLRRARGRSGRGDPDLGRLELRRLVDRDRERLRLRDRLRLGRRRHVSGPVARNRVGRLPRRCVHRKGGRPRDRRGRLRNRRRERFRERFRVRGRRGAGRRERLRRREREHDGLRRAVGHWLDDGDVLGFREREAGRLRGWARARHHFHGDRVHRHLRPEGALRLLGQVQLLAPFRLAAHDAEEHQRAARLCGLELVEPREGDRVLQGAVAVEPLEQRPHLRADLRERGLALGRRLEDRAEIDMAESEPAIGDALGGRQDEPLGGELEVHGALREDPVLELEGARLPRQHVGEDPLDLVPGRVTELALVHEAALGQDLGQGVARAHLGVHLVELLAGDAPPLDEDRAELVARVLRGAEEDPSSSEVEVLAMHRAGHLEGSRGPVAMQIHEEVGERRRLDVPADRERFRHSPSAPAVAGDASRAACQNL